jgi:hypothetical protein
MIRALSAGNTAEMQRILSMLSMGAYQIPIFIDEDTSS